MTLEEVEKNEVNLTKKISRNNSNQRERNNYQAF